MKKWLAVQILHLLGWKIEGNRPQMQHCVMIAAPHTSNWDFPMMMLFTAAFELKIRWMAKHNLFRPPLGLIMRALGGVPIIRHRKSNMVTSMIEQFKKQEQFILVVPAEGTRGRTEHWKSGFYHIAHGAGVPILLSYLDYSKKRGGFGPEVPTSGNIEADMDILRNFYAPMQGKFPDLSGPVELREENPKL